MKRYLLVFSLFFFSCDKFLDIKPKAEIVEKIYFEKAEGYEDALYGLYASLSIEQLYGENLSWGMLDAFGQYYTKYFIDKPVRVILSLDHEQMRGPYAAIWTKMYESIGFANNILRNLDLTDDKALKNYNLYKGEALGMRAFLHFDLLKMFAPQYKPNSSARGIPYVKIYESLVTPFSTVEEVYGFIIEDLLQAEKLLEQDQSLLNFPRVVVINDGFKTAREIHFNLYAAQALLARVYWMKGDLVNAAIYAKKVIDSGKFPLEDKVNIKNFLAGRLSGRETIFGLYNDKNLPLIQRNFYNYDPSYTWLPAADNLSLYSIPQDEGNDMRGAYWFRALPGGGEFDHIIRCMKIVNEDKIRDPAYKSPAKEGINLIRIPEMYLIMAEALLEKDPIAARSYYDTFIESRGLFKWADLPGNRQLTLAAINKERRKEFAQEGQYFYTLKRMNADLYVDVLKTTLKGSDQLYTFLIPDDEFEYRND